MTTLELLKLLLPMANDILALVERLLDDPDLTVEEVDAEIARLLASKARVGDALQARLNAAVPPK
jgi:hypothetical protein